MYSIKHNNKLIKKLVECLNKSVIELDEKKCGKLFSENYNHFEQLSTEIKLEIMKIIPNISIPFMCSQSSYEKLCLDDNYWVNLANDMYNIDITKTQYETGTAYRIYKDIRSLKDNYMRVYKYIPEFRKKQWKITEFNVDKLLGTGTYGHVYLATASNHKNLPVVIKFINKSNLKSNISNPENAKQMLEKEVSNQSKFTSPYIVQIYTAFEDNDNYYIVMEYCPGQDVMDKLIDLRKLKKRLTLSEIKKIILQTARALHEIHSKGITHRDVKAENIIFCGNGYKLTDFGLSSDEPILHTRTGTLDYLSPEIISGKYDYRTDVWSLGVLFYLLLFRQFPFEDMNAIEIGEYNIPKTFITGADLESALDLLSGMLTKNVNDRITTGDIVKHPFLVNSPLKSSKKKHPEFVTPESSPRKHPEFVTPD